MNKQSVLLFVTAVLCFRLPAQNKISGTLLNQQGDPLPYSSLGLMKANDSSLVKGNMTDDKGRFLFEKTAAGTYLIKAGAVGFNDFYSAAFAIDSLAQLNLPPMTLLSTAVNLDEVAVSVLKKPIEFKNGNITVNVEGSALAVGNTVYDLLVRMPGVLVDGDNISLQGRGGARILIDNRLQQLAGPQLVSLLKGINASTVEKIEIINNPSAKYDASGSGGLINIYTKKVKITGFSGSLMLNCSQGFYANSFGQLSLNYKGKQFSVFTNYNYNYADMRAINDWHREVKDDSLTTVLDQHYVEKTSNRFVSLFAGADWYPDKKNTISIRINLRPGEDKVIRHAVTNISNNSLGYDNLNFEFEKPNNWFWQDYSLNYEFVSDTQKTKLSFNASYSIYPDNYNGFFKNHYLDYDYIDVMPVKIFRSSNQVEITAATARLDFEKTFSKKLKMETGFKVLQQGMQSDFLFENQDNLSGLYVRDTALSNNFLYNEQIMAAYADLNKEIKKFNFRFGLRGENTSVNAESQTSNVKYKRDYFNLFPVASIDFNHSDNHNYQLSYNRRINRADYNNFNPYRAFRTMLTYVQGNPYLAPQYTNRVELRHTYKGKLSNSLSYSRMANYFFSYNRENTKTKELIFFNGNLGKAEIFSYGLFYQADFFKWWTVSLNLGSHYFRCSGTIDGVYYSTSALNTNIYMFHQFSLSKNSKMEVSFWGVGPWKDGVTYFKSRGGLSIGLRQSFMKDKLTVSCGVQDVLYTMPVSTVIDYNNQYSRSYHKWDSRRIYINANFNFGKIKVQQKNIKENEEVKGRLKK
jgi:hypothetical protein